VGNFFDTLFPVAIYPLTLLLSPLDSMIQKIAPQLNDGLGYLNDFFAFIGSIPEYLCYITGLNPNLWNAFCGLAISYMLIASLIGLAKKVINIAEKVRSLIG